MQKRLLLILAIVSCSSSEPLSDTERPSEAEKPSETVLTRDSSAPIQTDSLSYTLKRDALGWATRIPFTYRNPTADTIYVVNCNRTLAMALEQRAGDAWRTNWHPALPVCLSAPVVIAPGAVYVDTMAIFGAPPGRNVAPEFGDTTFTGTYRLVWHNLVTHYRTDAGANFGGAVPLEYRYSNEFVLRKAKP